MAAACSSSSTGSHGRGDAASTSGDAAAGAPGTGGNSGSGTGGRDASVGGNSTTGGSAGTGGTTIGSGGGNGGTSVDAGDPTADGTAPNTDGSTGGGGTQGTGGDAEASSSGGSGGGVDAGAGGSTAAAESGTTDGTTGTGGSSSSCSEAPCKLTTPQCGCGSGEQCSLVGSSRACTAEGTVQEAQTCSPSALCAPGLLCVALSQSVATCQKFCSTDADCESPGGLCAKTLLDGQGGTIPNATLCSENCNPVSNAGCSIAGTSCRIGVESTVAQRTYTDCGAAGTQTQGAVCDPSLDECAPGYVCLAVGVNQPNCLKYCTYPASSCPATTTCMAMNPAVVIGGTSYGVCY